MNCAGCGAALNPYRESCEYCGRHPELGVVREVFVQPRGATRMFSSFTFDPRTVECRPGETLVFRQAPPWIRVP